jgi:hypothetical protein
MQMQREGLYGEADQKLVHEVYSDTDELLKSGKSIGVIKRSHTRAIGGYLALKNTESPLTYIIDKLILSLVMPPKTVFDYHRRRTGPSIQLLGKTQRDRVAQEPPRGGEL